MFPIFPSKMTCMRVFLGKRKQGRKIVKNRVQNVVEFFWNIVRGNCIGTRVFLEVFFSHSSQTRLYRIEIKNYFHFHFFKKMKIGSCIKQTGPKFHFSNPTIVLCLKSFSLENFGKTRNSHHLNFSTLGSINPRNYIYFLLSFVVILFFFLF